VAWPLDRDRDPDRDPDSDRDPDAEADGEVEVEGEGEGEAEDEDEEQADIDLLEREGGALAKLLAERERDAPSPMDHRPPRTGRLGRSESSSVPFHGPPGPWSIAHGPWSIAHRPSPMA
jgi:hypothetical protein